MARPKETQTQIVIKAGSDAELAKWKRVISLNGKVENARGPKIGKTGRQIYYMDIEEEYSSKRNLCEKK